jgi:hypothetical protein
MSERKRNIRRPTIIVPTEMVITDNETRISVDVYADSQARADRDLKSVSEVLGGRFEKASGEGPRRRRRGRKSFSPGYDSGNTIWGKGEAGNVKGTRDPRLS